MADALTSQTLFDGDKHVVMKFTNITDVTGEPAVKKVDVSVLQSDINGNTCTSVVIEKIWWQCIGMKVRLFFDATSDKFIIELGENQSGYHDYSEFGGIKNNAGSGKTGDIDFTTVGHSSADTYTIILKMRKTY